MLTSSRCFCWLQLLGWAGLGWIQPPHGSRQCDDGDGNGSLPATLFLVTLQSPGHRAGVHTVQCLPNAVQNGLVQRVRTPACWAESKRSRPSKALGPELFQFSVAPSCQNGLCTSWGKVDKSLPKQQQLQPQILTEVTAFYVQRP